MSATILNEPNVLAALRAASEDGIHVEVWKIVAVLGSEVTPIWSKGTFFHGLNKATATQSHPAVFRSEASRMGIHTYIVPIRTTGMLPLEREIEGCLARLVRCTARLEDYIAGGEQYIRGPKVAVFSQLWMHLDELGLVQP